MGEQYVNGEISRYEMDHARQSFVSGHAADGWCLLSLLSVCLFQSYQYAMCCETRIGQIGYDGRTFFGAHLWYTMRKAQLVSIGIVFIPIYYALYVSLTRISDYKHSAEDVIGGALVGFCASFVSYLVYRR